SRVVSSESVGACSMLGPPSEFLPGARGCDRPEQFRCRNSEGRLYMNWPPDRLIPSWVDSFRSAGLLPPPLRGRSPRSGGRGVRLRGACSFTPHPAAERPPPPPQGGRWEIKTAR